MKAVILVGGEGTRLRPLTCRTPKPMLPLVNRPFLEHVIEYLREHGIRDVILSMCYRPDSIREYFGDGSRLGVSLVYEVESSPLGTAGGVKNVERYLDDTFFVFNGDVLTDLDLGSMLARHRAVGAKATIALTPVEDPTAYGLVETLPDGRVTQFVEKPSWDRVTTNLINAGTYILEPDVLKLVPLGMFHMFERGVFPELLERGDLMIGFPSNAYWLDIGTPLKYLTAHNDVLTGRVDVAVSGQEVQAGVWVGDGCSIDQSAVISGPVVIGSRVSVGRGATLAGPLTLGDECAIGSNATVDGAVIWRRSMVGERAMVKNSLVGTGVRIGEGTVLLDGTVVGDDCCIGSGNHLEHGIRIWPAKSLASDTITF